MATDEMSCDAYTVNVTSLVRQAEMAIVRHRNVTDDALPLSSAHRLSFLVNDVLSPIVCLFGVVGNALNLVVLTRRRLQHSMDGLERSVQVETTGDVERYGC